MSVQLNGKFIKDANFGGHPATAMMYNGSIVWHKLPEDYQEVEYLESTGVEYIDLPFGFDETDEAYAIAAMRQPLWNPSKYFVSPKTWDNTNKFALGGLGVERFKFAFGDTDPSYQYRYDYDKGQFILVPADEEMHEYHYKDRMHYMYDLELSYDLSKARWKGPTDTLKLFYGYSTPTKCAIGKYWHKKDGFCVCYLKPCYRKADNKPGFYNIVDGTFYTNNASTGEFITGPEVNN